MKRIVRFIALAMAGILALGVSTVLAENENNNELEATFHSRSGTVVSITDISDDAQRIRIEGEYGTIDFNTDYNTFVLGDPIEVGDYITGFFPFGFAIAIYPPQHLVYLIVNGEFDNVKINRFNLNEELGALVSADGELQLNFTDDTPILLQDGQDFREVLEEIRAEYEYLDIEPAESLDLLDQLNGRMLVVVYGPTTRGVVPITIPGEDGQNLTIHVLFERIAHGPADIGFGIEDPDEDDIVQIDWPISEIVINGEITDLNWLRIRGGYYVPFRAAVNALGFGDTIVWVGETRTIYVENDDRQIRFSIESNEFQVNGEVVELDHPAVLVGDSTYVPFRFFSLVFGMNNAFLLEGQIVIDNEKPMV